MLKKLTLNKNKKGFTLIELMIVIAIIGILAAIAVPQFAAYRLRSFNASAKSVCHSLKSDQANLYSETTGYGNVFIAANLATGIGNNTVSGAADTAANTSGIVGATKDDAGGALGNNRLTVACVLGKDMTAGTVTSSDYLHHVSASRHFKGDTAYGQDSDIESRLYAVSNGAWIKEAGLQASLPASGNVDEEDDLLNLGGGGAPNSSWYPPN